MKSKKDQQKNRAIWKMHIENWKKSGQTKVAFCRKYGLNPDNFGYYYRQLNTSSSSTQAPNNFIELKAMDQKARPSMINFKLKSENGCTIEWSVDWTVNELKAFIDECVST